MSNYLKIFACLVIAGVALSSRADTTYTATGVLAGTNTSVALGPNGAPTVTDVTGTLTGTAVVSDAGVIESLNMVIALSDGVTVNVDPSNYSSIFGTGSDIAGGMGGGTSTSGVYIPVPGEPSSVVDDFFFYIPRLFPGRMTAARYAARPTAMATRCCIHLPTTLDSTELTT